MYYNVGNPVQEVSLVTQKLLRLRRSCVRDSERLLQFYHGSFQSSQIGERDILLKLGSSPRDMLKIPKTNSNMSSLFEDSFMEFLRWIQLKLQRVIEKSHVLGDWERCSGTYLSFLLTLY